MLGGSSRRSSLQWLARSLGLPPRIESGHSTSFCESYPITAEGGAASVHESMHGIRFSPIRPAWNLEGDLGHLGPQECSSWANLGSSCSQVVPKVGLPYGQVWAKLETSLAQCSARLGPSSHNWGQLGPRRGHHRKSPNMVGYFVLLSTTLY